MTRAILRELVLKEWHRFRYLIAGSVLAGFASLVLCTLNQGAFYFGTVSFICALVVLVVMLPMSGVADDRRSRSVLFVLTLPISPADYGKATILANGSAFFVPWLVLTAAAAVTIAISAIPDGLLPFTMMLAGYFPVYYVLLLGISLLSAGQGATVATIVAGNVSINFVMYLLSNMPSVRPFMDGPSAVWNRGVFSVLAAESLAVIAIIAVTLYLQARRKDLA